MSVEDFFAGVAAMFIVGVFIALVVGSHRDQEKQDRAYADCLYQHGVLVQEIPTGYACINTNSLHSWHEGP